jgi:hypothetical protein
MMVETPTLSITIKIETDSMNSDRFRWAIYGGDQVLVRSLQSYATPREAKNNVDEALKLALSPGNVQ